MTEKILLIQTSPRRNGFSAAVVAIAGKHLAKSGSEVKSVHLADYRFSDCMGCFACLKTGICPLQDDLETLKKEMLEATGLVIAGGVRNGRVGALYKRFVERITYTMGFPLLLEGKYVLSMSSVGIMGGRGDGARFYGLQDVFSARHVGHLHFVSGIPSREPGEADRVRVHRSCDALLHAVRTRRQRSLLSRMTLAIDRAIMRRFVLAKKPDFYAHVIEIRKQNGLW